MRGDAWRALWEDAHREMEPWGRVPAPYLIDSLLHERRANRRWLRHRFARIAQVTREHEHDFEETSGTLRWVAAMTDPTGRRRMIRILVNPINNTIFNAFPE